MRSSALFHRAALAILIASGTVHAQQINTGVYPINNGYSYIGPFGTASSATYGQTFKLPVGNSALSQFTFQLRGTTRHSATPFTFSAFVAEWDGEKIIGDMLYTSSVSVSPTTPSYTLYTYDTPNIVLNASSTYVAFLNASPFIADHAGDEPTPNLQAEMRLGTGGYGASNYDDGVFVYANNGGDFSALSSAPWDGVDSGIGDAAFTATFDTQSDATPEPATWVLLASGLAGISFATRRRRA